MINNNLTTLENYENWLNSDAAQALAEAYNQAEKDAKSKVQFESPLFNLDGSMKFTDYEII